MPITKAQRRKAKKTGKWYEHGKSLGWSKDDSQAKRRAAALRSRKGDALKAAKALQGLANVTTDYDTKRKARADAIYFFNLHKRTRRFAVRK